MEMVRSPEESGAELEIAVWGKHVGRELRRQRLPTAEMPCHAAMIWRVLFGRVSRLT
jgi:hypothetical protein